MREFREALAAKKWHDEHAGEMDAAVRESRTRKAFNDALREAIGVDLDDILELA